MNASLNTSNPAVKRILSEVKKLQADPSVEFEAHPVDDNLFDWHFVLRGPEDTPFAGGLFHGRIILPQQYPYKPPEFMFLCPQGRFEVGKKICLSISQHHPELWQPGWDIRTALTAIQSFMPTPGNGAIAALDYSDDERRALAKKSKDASISSLTTAGMLESFIDFLDSEKPATATPAAAGGSSRSASGPESASGAGAATSPANTAATSDVPTFSATNAATEPPTFSTGTATTISQTPPAADPQAGSVAAAATSDPAATAGSWTETQATPVVDSGVGTNELRHRRSGQPESSLTPGAAVSDSPSVARAADSNVPAPAAVRPSPSPSAARSRSGNTPDRTSSRGTPSRPAYVRSGSSTVSLAPPSEDELMLASWSHFLVFCILLLVARRALVTYFPEIDWQELAVQLWNQLLVFVEMITQDPATPGKEL